MKKLKVQNIIRAIEKLMLDKIGTIWKAQLEMKMSMDKF